MSTKQSLNGVVLAMCTESPDIDHTVRPHAFSFGLADATRFHRQKGYRTSRGFNQNASGTSRIAGPNDDLHVVAHSCKEVHEPLDGKALEPILQQR
jgi:hypothetical protein